VLESSVGVLASLVLGGAVLASALGRSVGSSSPPQAAMATPRAAIREALRSRCEVLLLVVMFVHPLCG
jgi:hypothetical protein